MSMRCRARTAAPTNTYQPRGILPMTDAERMAQLRYFTLEQCAYALRLPRLSADLTRALAARVEALTGGIASDA